MPASGTQFKNRIMPVNPIYNNGIMSLNESAAQGFSAGNFTLRESCGFQVSTGTTLSPDVTPGQSANVTLIPDGVVPYGTRCYLTSLGIDVQGMVNWGVTSPTTGAVPYLAVQDSLGIPAAVAPFLALKGGAELFFPSADVSIPMLLGPNTVNGPAGNPVAAFTYAPSTGIVTLASGSFLATGIGVGSPIRVVDGTGKGQSAFVTAITTTTITVSPAFTGLDATSVIGMDWSNISGYTNTTTLQLPNNAGATNYTANALDNGFNLIGISGAGSGAIRPIQANTAQGVITLPFALNTAMAAGGSIVQVTNNTELNGAVDCCIADKWATLSLNKGLQIAVNLQSGTSPVGSTVRVYAEGFFAP